MQNKEGFTLIEMLVVIAMIGLLSAVVLVALGPSRNKAKDTRIISDIQQIRAIAETLYNPVTNTYSGLASVSASTCSVTSEDSNINKAFADIGQNGGKNCVVSVSGTNYAISASLTSAASSYCSDSMGNVSSGVASGGSCPASAH